MKRLGIGLLLFTLAMPLPAREYSGINLAEVISLAGQELVLNGAGIRARFFVDLYLAALYLPRRTDRAEEAIGMPGPKRMLLYILHDEISRDKATAAFDEGFRANLAQEELLQLAPQLEKFHALLETVRKGDRVIIDLLPGETRFSNGDTVKGSIEGHELQTALLKIWLGAQPVSSSLKRGLLGR